MKEQECKCELDGFQGAVWTGDCPLHGNKPMTTMRERTIEYLLSQELDVLESAIGDENKALAICSREEIWKLVYRLVEQELKKEREEIVEMIKSKIRDGSLEIKINTSVGMFAADIINTIKNRT